MVPSSDGDSDGDDKKVASQGNLQEKRKTLTHSLGRDKTIGWHFDMTNDRQTRNYCEKREKQREDRGNETKGHTKQQGIRSLETKQRRDE